MTGEQIEPTTAEYAVRVNGEDVLLVAVVRDGTAADETGLTRGPVGDDGLHQKVELLGGRLQSAVEKPVWAGGSVKGN